MSGLVVDRNWIEVLKKERIFGKCTRSVLKKFFASNRNRVFQPCTSCTKIRTRVSYRNRPKIRLCLANLSSIVYPILEQKIFIEYKQDISHCGLQLI